MKSLLFFYLILLQFNFCGDIISINNSQSNNRLSLNLPSNFDYAQENLSLTIHLPNKIKPSDEIKQLNRTIIKKKFDFKTNLLRGISKKSRFHKIMRNFAKKGLITSSHDMRMIRARFAQKEHVARIIIRVFKALETIHERKELKRYKIKRVNIEDLKELIDEFQRAIKMYTYHPIDMQQKLDIIQESVLKTSGRGSLFITGITESDDGTVLNIEISKQ
ncbi:MAG: hypothetical protein COB02_04575 [Candidatus Cloacimonadota bacterium]|nr:MAG: hypothetical protein COB02_04575 [Candidatus Cloacimonadota bacterium]